REFTPVDFDDEALAFGAHEEVGAGGHFLGAEHTMERFRTCFYRPCRWNSDNFERWTRLGARDVVERAREIYEKKLEDYEQPPLDDAIRAELEEYIVKRRAELGD
ncbi:MAG: trimethylamine methyltransferase family protein, partial [Actinomycetota bacterium]